jgi:hypothetical protein
MLLARFGTEGDSWVLEELELALRESGGLDRG